MNSVKSATKLPLLELMGVVAAEAALVVALHLAASPAYAVPLRTLPEWLQTADPTVALVATARLAALGIGYWLLATTILYASAYHLGWRSVTSALRWVTLPFVRRVVQGVTALSLTSASLMGPAAVAPPPVLAQSTVVAPDVYVEDATDPTAGTGTTSAPTTEPVGPAGYLPEAAGWPDAGDNAEFWRPDAATQTEGLSTAATNHTVVPSDNLWAIAEGHLRQATGREVTEDEVGQYWRRVVDANLGSLRSGDPDLIYPDEQVTLPPVFSD